MELIACVSKDIIDLVPKFLANRQAEVARLRTALVAHDWPRVQELAERMLALGNPYGFRQITTFGRFMRQACLEHNVQALMDLINAYAHYLSRVAVIEVEVPKPAKPDEKAAARAAK
jgi:hypothetical protein